MNNAPVLFDRALVRRRITRAAKYIDRHDALMHDTAEQLVDRLADVNRAFLDTLDLSPFPFLAECRQDLTVMAAPEPMGYDEEALPFVPESFDLIVSNLGLHWVNDVPGALAQIRAALKPNGMFLAALIGEQSLHELRACLLDAELSVCGGISPRLSPTIDLLTASQLMQRAGFTLPVADKDMVTVLYPDMFALLRDLRGMGQTNTHTQRLRTPTRRAVFFEAARLYQQRFANTKGHIRASFDIIYLHGWK